MRQPRSYQNNGQASLTGSMQCGDQCRELIFLDVWKLVDKYCERRLGGRYAHRLKQRLQIVLNPPVRIEIEPDLDVLVFYLERLGETGQPAQCAYCKGLGLGVA